MVRLLASALCCLPLTQVANAASPQTFIDDAGIYGLLPGNVRVNDGRVSRFLDHPLTAGISVRTDWKTLEPVDDKYDWSYLDDMLAVAAESDKKIMLRVVSAWMSPDWVYEAGAKDFWYNEKHNNNQLSRMPVPWDTIYLNKWRDFVKALGERYNNNSNLAVIAVTGASRSAEMYLPNSTEDIAQWDAIGYSETKIVSAWTFIIDTFAAAFPDKPIILPVSNIRTNDNAATESVVEYATNTYPWHLATKIAYWKDTNDSDYAPTAAMIDATNRSAHGGLEPAGAMEIDPAVSLAISWKTVTWIEPYEKQIDDLADLYDEVTRHQQIVSSACMQGYVRASNTVRLRWTTPSGYTGYQGVRIVRKEGIPAQGINDPNATIIYEGSESTATTDTNVVNGKDYFYTMFEMPSGYIVGQLAADPGGKGALAERCK